MNVGGIQQMGIKWEEDGRVGWGLEALFVVVAGGSFEDERERDLENARWSAFGRSELAVSWEMAGNVDIRALHSNLTFSEARRLHFSFNSLPFNCQ